MRKLFGVIGNPIAHSLSPCIHRRFAEQFGFGIELEYRKIAAPLDGFAAAVADFAKAGGRGLNVTAPFKHEAFALAAAARRTQRAERAGAVNTLSIEEDGTGTFGGDNTDGAGLVNDLRRNLGVTLAARRLLIFGAGGAAAGILGPLLDEGPAAIHIANRTGDKAEALAAAFNKNGLVIYGGGYEVVQGPYDLVLNASAAGWQGQAPPLPRSLFAPGAFAYDLVYGDEETAFLHAARKAGAAHACDGTGMLVEQAALSFAHWHKREPDTAAVIAALKRGAGKDKQ